VLIFALSLDVVTDPTCDSVYPVIPAKAGGVLQQRSWSSSDLGFPLCVTARLLACAAGVSPACRRPSYFSLLVHAHAGACANSEAGPKGAGHGCPESRKSNQKKGHPGARALRVRERVTGFFDSTSCAGEKLAGIRASHPSGFPSPVRRALRGPGLRARAARGARTSCCRFAPVEQQRRSAIRFFSSLFALRSSLFQECAHCAQGVPLCGE
jgi:hypothetical protein